MKEKAVYNAVTLTEDPVAFKRLVEYLHTEDFADKSTYTNNEIVTILKLGHRHCPQKVSDDMRMKLLDRGLRLTNAYQMLNNANQFGLSALKDMATAYIDGVNRNAEMYLKSEDFLELEENCLVNLLQSDDLACPEIKLFEAIIRWGKRKQEAVPSSASLRDILDSAIYQIRFPLMTPLQLSTVDDSQVLTSEEMKGLSAYVSAGIGLRRFISRPRAPAISQQDEDDEGEGVDQTNDDIDIDYSIVKFESPMLFDTSRSATPLINFVDDSINRDDDFMVQIKNEDQAVNLVSQTWHEMLEKAGQIPKTTTGLILICTVETDAQLRGKIISRVSLPHLKKIELDLHIPPKLKSKPNAILLQRKKYDVEKHLFFKEDRDDDVNIDCKVIMNGCTFLKWSPAEEEVIVGFGGRHSEPFLERLKDKNFMERFNMLTIVDNKLANVRGTVPGFPVKDIMLWGVDDESPSLLGDFLWNFVNLESLSCWTKGPPKKLADKHSPIREISVIDINRDLTSGYKLVKLSVCEAALVVHPEDNIANIVKHNLTEFYTTNCHFSPEIYAHFHEMFPKLRKVSFGHKILDQSALLFEQENEKAPKRRKISPEEETLMSAQSVQLVNNILKIKDIEMIRIACLDWDLGPKSRSVKNNVMDFLKRAGWTRKYPPSDFLVTKDATTGKWEMDPAISSEGRNADENTWEHDMYWDYTDKSEFEYFGLSRIFKDFDTFKNYNVV
ncbi:uncharacterized protein LOC118432857 [Folsomia candida]|nr:uncharacterized protein LOC118432857 [Folsomia candida]